MSTSWYGLTHLPDPGRAQCERKRETDRQNNKKKIVVPVDAPDHHAHCQSAFSLRNTPARNNSTTQLSTAKRDETTMGIFSLLPVTRTRMEAAPVSQVGGPPTKRVSETFEQKLYRKVSSTREYKPKTLDERQMKDVFLSLVVVVVVSLLSRLFAASIHVANNVCVCVCVCMLSITQRLYFVPLFS